MTLQRQEWVDVSARADQLAGLNPETYEILGDAELDDETDARLLGMTAEADGEIAAGESDGETRVNIRWDTAPLTTIRRAADLQGVPYQTYVKQAAFRQALTDLKDAEAAGLR